MKDIQEKTREQVMRIVNDIIYMAHRIRVPSKRVKELFVDQILRLDELKEYFEVQEEIEQKVKEKGE
ncbi:MAG: hypothetical protein NUV31_04020 [Dehalococcoidales bacterium]|jgi:hypothetical protein|nr:hypothetical protein [Dehalococcoidales bacterium]